MASALGAAKGKNILEWVLHFVVLSTKHPGFAEEKEWRIIHSPTIHGSDHRMHSETQVIKNVPQQIYKLPLIDGQKENLPAVVISGRIDRIIIGPSASADVMQQVLIGAPKSAKVENAENRVTISNIPLRR